MSLQTEEIWEDMYTRRIPFEHEGGEEGDGPMSSGHQRLPTTHQKLAVGDGAMSPSQFLASRTERQPICIV